MNDLALGEKLKEEGMDAAAQGKRQVLEYAQLIAIELAKADPNRECDADQVQNIIRKSGYELGNAAGSIFKGGKWVCVGFKKSERPQNHARLVRVWRLL